MAIRSANQVRRGGGLRVHGSQLNRHIEPRHRTSAVAVLECNLVFKFIFVFNLQKYTIISKFNKTNLPPLWPMVVPRRLATVAPTTAVAHGG
jgi:hypothetical protein